MFMCHIKKITNHFPLSFIDLLLVSFPVFFVLDLKKKTVIVPKKERR